MLGLPTGTRVWLSTGVIDNFITVDGLGRPGCVTQANWHPTARLGNMSLEGRADIN